SYISQVLPELGETNMRQITFYDLAVKMLGKQYEIQDWNERTEEIITEADASIAGRQSLSIEYKSSPAFGKMIEKYAESLMTSGIRFRPLRFRNEVILSAQDIEEYYY